MWSAIIGGALSLGSAALGAVKSAQQNREIKDMMQGMRNDNRAWYNARMSEDYTQRSDAQAVINKQRELLDEQYKKARAANIVAGGTDEQLALQQQAANQSLAQTMSGIASEASAHKDNVEQQYRAQDQALNQQQLAMKQAESQATGQAAGQAVNAGVNLVGTYLQKKA